MVQYSGAQSNHAKISIALNIVKYFSSFPPIWLAAGASLGYFHPNLPLLTAVMAFINSSISYLWDIVMDWGLISISKKGKLSFRSKIYYPVIFYIFAAAVNLILRFSWAINRVPQLQNVHPAHLVLIVEVAEIIRRSIWSIFRIEWEVIVKNPNLDFEFEK